MNRILREHALPGGPKLEIVQGDLTQESTDAIVNAANRLLQHGGGVAGAIARQGGRVIQEESDQWVRQHGPVTHDSPACTSAGRLPSRYVIHAVGPIWEAGQPEACDAQLSTAVRASLDLANRMDLHSIAMPAISTGIYGFPLERAATLILAAILEFFKANRQSELQVVRVVLFDPQAAGLFSRTLDNLAAEGPA